MRSARTTALEFVWATTSLLALTVVFLWLLDWATRLYRSGLPPGPKPLPLLGNLHQIAMSESNILDTLTKWGKKYGDVYTLHIGPSPAIILNTYETIKEAFSRPVFEGRPKNFLSEVIAENMGIAFCDGPLWREQRRFAVSHMKGFGTGQTACEANILDELGCLVKVLEDVDGEQINAQYVLNNSVANNITMMLWGKRYELENESFRDVLKALDKNFQLISRIVMADAVFPLLKFLPFDVLGVKRAVDDGDHVRRFLEDIVEDHKCTSSQDKPARDFTDLYLSELAKENLREGSTFSEKQLVKMLCDFFVGGMENTTSALRWILLFLILHPKIQQRARLEVDAVIGDRKPSMSDRPRMPYLEAVIMESHRLGMVGATAAVHAPLEHTVLKGHSISRGTTVIANIVPVCLDEKVFPEPRRFSPERYIENGKFNRSACERVIPFGIGRRSCVGESLATTILFLYSATLLQRFTFHSPEDGETPSLDGIMGFGLIPRPFQICFHKR